MKLIFAIVSNHDSEKVMAAIGAAGFMSTKIPVYGQLLKDGHSCIMCGIDEQDKEAVLSVIENNVTKRVVRSYGVSSTLSGSLLKQPVDVEENGGVAFVIDIDEYKRF